MLIRLLMRFVLVPLGAVIAAAAAAAVIGIAHWNALAAVANAGPPAQPEELFAILAAGPVLASMVWLWGANAVAPAVTGVLMSEALGIRSWIFHAANGGLAAGIGWALMREFDVDKRDSTDLNFKDFDDVYRVLAEPQILIAAGLAAGLAYWMVAGWTAGFWKPVRAPRPAQPPGA